jgi:hypothetical protein
MFDEAAESPNRRWADHQPLTDPILGVPRLRDVVGVYQPVLVSKHVPLLDQSELPTNPPTKDKPAGFPAGRFVLSLWRRRPDSNR